MTRTLRYDGEARELRLVLTDYWKGEHEHIEYRVVDEESVPLRGSRHEGWDGQTVYFDGGRFYVKPDGLYSARVVSFTTEQQPVVANKVHCPRFMNRRRRCTKSPASALSRTAGSSSLDINRRPPNIGAVGALSVHQAIRRSMR